MASENRDVPPGEASSFSDLVLGDVGSVELRDEERPELYEVLVRLHEDGRCIDHHAARVGFREARFAPDSFYLNGRRLKLCGLNRHQTYHHVGGAMPARVQRRDASILKNELKCNFVRASRYPQSAHFLDCCDEIALVPKAVISVGPEAGRYRR